MILLTILQKGSSYKNISSCLYLFVWEFSSEHTKGEWSPKVRFLSLYFRPIRLCVLLLLVRQLGVSSGERTKYRGRQVVFLQENMRKLENVRKNARKIGIRLRRYAQLIKAHKRAGDKLMQLQAHSQCLSCYLPRKEESL